jgi:hypothetical protein
MIPLAGIATGALAVFLSHREKMARIKAQAQMTVGEGLRAELDEIKRQIATLRDTTTRFDMSFDAAISRLEERMDRVDGQHYSGGTTVSADAPPIVAEEPTRAYGSSEAPEYATLNQRRG